MFIFHAWRNVEIVKIDSAIVLFHQLCHSYLLFAHMLLRVVPRTIFVGVRTMLPKRLFFYYFFCTGYPNVFRNLRM